jgi:TonB-linked SusC/RagA family outer membrane protein
MKKVLRYSLILCLLLGAKAYAQDRVVSGKVTAADDKLPIPGVTVKAVGANAATQTNADGFFTLNIPEGVTQLQFSFLGYATRTLPIAAGAMNVVLKQDSMQLQEVVVSALGIERQKREVGYSSATLNNDVITRAAAVNVANGLQGKVSGLNVTSVNNGVFEDVKINLRGIRSLTGNNNPLLVLDGVPADLGYLSSINPNDIASVTVLKGASAAALYGPDARNGVLVVSTKRGVVKGGDDRPVISFGTSSQFQQISFYPKFQKQFGSGGGGSYIPYENWSWGPAFDGSMVTIGQVLPNGLEQKVPYTANNSREEFFNTGVTTQNDLSFAATDFYLSVQDANISGIVPDDKNRRTGIRLNTSKEYGKFVVGLNTNYSQQNYNIFDDSSMGAWNTDNNVGLNQGLMNLIFNTPASIPLTKYKDFENDTFSQYDNYFNDYGLNPYFAIDNWRKFGKREDLITNLDISFKPTKWLNLTYRAALNNRSINERRTSRGETPTAFGLERGSKPIPGFVEERSYKNSRLSSEFFANVTKNINDDLKFNALAGTYVRQNEIRDTRVGVTSLVVPELFDVSNRVGQLTGSSPYSLTRLFSLYGSIGLGYKGWANIEITGRNDRTSVLALNKNSFFYPGVSGSLVLSDAIPGLKESETLSYLKLRAAWNKTGNAEIAPYQLAATYSQASGFPYGTLPGFTANNTTYDPNLEPEFIKSLEFGLETSFIDNRVTLEATYFKQNNDNQIIPISISAATGYTSSFVNAASFVNKGVEIDFKLTPLFKFRNGHIDIKTNATYNDSEVSSIYGEDLKELAIGGYTNVSNYAVTGFPAFIIKATDYVRDPDGHVIVDAITGMPEQNPLLTNFGRTMPKLILGINPSISWKGLTFSTLFEYKGGHYAYNDIGQAMAWTGVSAVTAQNNREKFVFPNSVIETAPGVFTPNTNVTINNVESFYTGVYRSVATNFITSAAAWRLRELTLNYDLPATLFSKQKIIRSASIALTGRNLALWVPKTNEYTDPDFNFSTGNTSGISNSNINPPTRIYGLSLNLVF